MGQSALLGCLIEGTERALVPTDIIRRIKPERGRATLAVLCRLHPKPIEFDSLLVASGLRGFGHERAALEYWLMRIEDDLPLAGWRLMRSRDIIFLTKE